MRWTGLGTILDFEEAKQSASQETVVGTLLVLCSVPPPSLEFGVLRVAECQVDGLMTRPQPGAEVLVCELQLEIVR